MQWLRDNWLVVLIVGSVTLGGYLSLDSANQKAHDNRAANIRDATVQVEGCYRYNNIVESSERLIDASEDFRGVFDDFLASAITKITPENTAASKQGIKDFNAQRERLRRIRFVSLNKRDCPRIEHELEQQLKTNITANP
jgi:hypothetical protein